MAELRSIENFGQIDWGGITIGGLGGGFGLVFGFTLREMETENFTTPNTWLSGAASTSQQSSVPAFDLWFLKSDFWLLTFYTSALWRAQPTCCGAVAMGLYPHGPYPYPDREEFFGRPFRFGARSFSPFSRFRSLFTLFHPRDLQIYEYTHTYSSRPHTHTHTDSTPHTHGHAHWQVWPNILVEHWTCQLRWFLHIICCLEDLLAS